MPAHEFLLKEIADLKGNIKFAGRDPKFAGSSRAGAKKSRAVRGEVRGQFAGTACGALAGAAPRALEGQCEIYHLLSCREH